MSAATLPPPLPAVCLTGSYASRKIKGGTVIAEDVQDLETHRRKLLDPDAYRAVVGVCRACRSARLHAHCFRERILRSAVKGEESQVETVRLYRCAVRACGAVFTVLPAIIARHLWRLWPTVEEGAAERIPLPRTTLRRWLGRLGCSAVDLVQTFGAQASSLVSSAVRSALARVGTRKDFVSTLRSSMVEGGSCVFAGIAAWIHRLEPGIRLM